MHAGVILEKDKFPKMKHCRCSNELDKNREDSLVMPMADTGAGLYRRQVDRLNPDW